MNIKPRIPESIFFFFNGPLRPDYFLPVYFLENMYTYIFGCAGSSLLHGLFSRCREWGLLSSCGVRVSYCGIISCGGARAQVYGLQ